MAKKAPKKVVKKVRPTVDSLEKLLTSDNLSQEIRQNAVMKLKILKGNKAITK